jgi:hypothetical protein
MHKSSTKAGLTLARKLELSPIENAPTAVASWTKLPFGSSLATR